MFSDSVRGDNFRDNLIPIDNHIKALWDSIADMGRVPVLPQLAETGYYTSEELGKLGEQYIACLFESLGIRKLPADRRNPSPDFKIKIYSRSYLLETKIVRHIHKTIYQILYELGRRENRQSLYAKLERLVLKHKITLSPRSVHFLDERKLKNKIRKVIRGVHFPITEKITKKLNCPLRDYIFTISPQGPEEEIIWPPDNGVSLGSIISRKRRQIGSSDFLFVIVVGKTNKREIQDLIYPGYNPGNRKILKSIWDLEYQTSDGKSLKIKSRLKGIFFLLPYNKKCFIACPPSEKMSRKIYYLKKYIEKTGYHLLLLSPK